MVISNCGLAKEHLRAEVLDLRLEPVFDIQAVMPSVFEVYLVCTNLRAPACRAGDRLMRFSKRTFLEASDMRRLSWPNRTGPLRIAHRIANDHLPRNTSFATARCWSWQVDRCACAEVLLNCGLKEHLPFPTSQSSKNAPSFSAGASSVSSSSEPALAARSSLRIESTESRCGSRDRTSVVLDSDVETIICRMLYF
jgi:hypothetical protein